MRERNGANAQTRVELTTAQWRTRRETDELTVTGPTPYQIPRQRPLRR